MTGDASRPDEPIETLLAVLDDPTEGRRRLPELVGMLDADESTVRIGAAWAVCHVAVALPDTVEYLTRRLVDRIDEQQRSIEAELAFEYVATQHPDAVADELDAIETEAENRPRFTSFDGSLARANVHRPEIADRDVGRTRLAGEGASSGSRRVYTDDDADSRRDRPDDAAAETAETDVADEDHDESDTDGDGTEDEGVVGGTREDLAGKASSDDEAPHSAADVPAIVSDSRFDQLTVLARARRGRYADVYRTLGVVEGEQLPVGLALYHRPSDHLPEFAAGLEEQLARWAGVSDHDTVVTVHDWGVEPRPWAATEYTGQRLAERDRLDPSEALWNARRLAAGVAHAHENGVVHGGLDPGNVVYYGNVIDEDERQPPLIDNVGLLHVVREHFDPTSRLDPRYAAPEYFDRQFGRIDHATDVYQLGAVIYLLFTGRPPYDGEYTRIRERVLEDPAPRPGDVVDLPASVDEVVTKAMAPRKLRRYETVRHMEQELRGIGDDFDDNAS